ncbi:hypothetical protein [Mycobacterium sp. URHB0021]
MTPTQLLWTSFGIITPEKVIELGGNLEGITDWKPADRPVYDSDFALPLRYGIPLTPWHRHGCHSHPQP